MLRMVTHDPRCAHADIEAREMKIWDTITEVNLDDIPPPGTVSSEHRGKYAELWQQIILRIEQTPSGRAIAITFQTYRETDNAAAAIRRLSNWRYGFNYLSVRVRKDTESAGILYISRGENWTKYPVLDKRRAWNRKR